MADGNIAYRRVVCFRTAKEIADYIGEHERAIPRLVIEEGLPAWKRKGEGAWRALDWHCDVWLLSQAAKWKPQAGADAQLDPDFSPVNGKIMSYK